MTSLSGKSRGKVSAPRVRVLSRSLYPVNQLITKKLPPQIDFLKNNCATSFPTFPSRNGAHIIEVEAGEKWQILIDGRTTFYEPFTETFHSFFNTFPVYAPLQMIILNYDRYLRQTFSVLLMKMYTRWYWRVFRLHLFWLNYFTKFFNVNWNWWELKTYGNVAHNNSYKIIVRWF